MVCGPVIVLVCQKAPWALSKPTILSITPAACLHVSGPGCSVAFNPLLDPLTHYVVQAFDKVGHCRRVAPCESEGAIQ